MTDDPLPLSRSLVLRIAFATLTEHARQLDGLAHARDDGRGARASSGLKAKAEGRFAQAASLRGHAARIKGWGASKEIRKGAGVDAAVAGYLFAWLVGSVEMKKQLTEEMRACEMAAARAIEDLRGDDYSTGVGIVCGIDAGEA